VADLSTWEVVARLLGAAGVGALIGLERDIDGHEAGLRTHLLLALGAGLFGVASVGAFDDFAAPRADTNFQVDVTRIASYVAAGVGFLGGGAIVKRRGSVSGLTTAASLWVAAAAGLAAGLGFWAGAVTAAVVAVLSLLARVPWQRWQRLRGRSTGTRRVVLRPTTAADVPTIVAVVEDTVGDLVERMSVRDDRVLVELSGGRQSARALIEALTGHAAVRELELAPR
jgi:putative Mg2+ transporter-C (MgtC) family protein